MVQHTGKPVIDFSRYITERTKDFMGREWVFQAVNDWLADPDGSRYFLLTGEPGSGKTAIASRLVQFSHGVVAPPAGLTHLTPGFLSAVHFCSARDSRWINPYVFAEALALQLAGRFPAYAKALAEKGGDRQVHIDVQQYIGQGQAIGVVINRLDISGVSPEDAFNRIVREPLEVLFRSGFDQQVVILIDGLDEALSYSGIVNIISFLAYLDELPAGVRFILTSRQDSRVGHAFLEAEELVLSASQYEQHNLDDIRNYVQSRLGEDIELAEKATQVEPARIAQIVEIVPRKAEGNFLYVRFLLDAMAQGVRPLTELEGLPEGLDALYYNSLERVVKLGKRDWLNDYVPLMGILLVAQESPTLAQLQAFTGQSESDVWQHLSDLQQFIEETKPQDRKVEPVTRYRLYHQSVSDFLCRQSFSSKKRQLPNIFYISAQEWHKALADRCENGNLAIIWEDAKHNLVEQGRREYARLYYITHLYQARNWPCLFSVLDTVQYGRARKRQNWGTKAHFRKRAALNSLLGLGGGNQQCSQSCKPLTECLPLLGKRYSFS